MLTKSNYIQFLQCTKQLWLEKFKSEVKPDGVDENLKKMFEAGFEVERLAYELFPGGVEIEAKAHQEKIYKTRVAMEKSTPVIFQPTVAGKTLYCRADIIQYNKDQGAWDIIEVKSSTEVKDIYIDDLSFQKLCFEEAGFKVGSVYLIHVNNKYVKKGEINITDLLNKEDVTEEVLMREELTKENIKKALEALKIKEEPDITILRQCYRPYECGFIPYCLNAMPDHSIYSIGGALGAKKLEQLLGEGVLTVEDIPPEYLTTDKLKKHHHAVKHNAIHCEPDNIKKELDKIKYPVYYLDYETFAPTIPIFDGYRPYQKIVFQYSLHIQRELDSELEHYYYLADQWKDPTKELAAKLKKLVGPEGSFLSWNMGFEQGCNTEMGERAPEFKEFFADVNNRMLDLMHVFQKGYYVHRDFYGSASLKKVLPAFIPELSYHELEIQEGMTASNSWREMIDPKTPDGKKKVIHEGLLAYCELDTLAMVEILKKLRKIVSGEVDIVKINKEIPREEYYDFPCNKCGRKRVQRIAYGLPIGPESFGPKDYPGGCCVEDKKWHCCACEYEW